MIFTVSAAIIFNCLCGVAAHVLDEIAEKHAEDIYYGRK
jgi:hypothetical protein